MLVSRLPSHFPCLTPSNSILASPFVSIICTSGQNTPVFEPIPCFSRFCGSYSLDKLLLFFNTPDLATTPDWLWYLSVAMALYSPFSCFLNQFKGFHKAPEASCFKQSHLRTPISLIYHLPEHLPSFLHYQKFHSF